MATVRNHYTVIAHLDHRFHELLVAGVVEGRVKVFNMEPKAGGYENVYYHVQAYSPEAAEKAVLMEIEAAAGA